MSVVAGWCISRTLSSSLLFLACWLSVYILFPTGQQDSTRETESRHHRSSTGQGFFGPYMWVGEGGGVYINLFAVSGSSVEPEITIDQPEAVRIESWTWTRARTDLELGGTNWNSRTTVIFKDRLHLRVSLITSNFDDADILQEKLAPFMELHMHLA